MNIAIRFVLASAFAFASIGATSGCRGSEPSTPANSTDAGTNSTTSGVIDEPHSPKANSGPLDPPERGDRPQVLPPELTPNRSP